MRLGDIERVLVALAGTDPVPPAVFETARFLATHRVWCQFSRNVTVRSCRDAARRRFRLGGRGIPLHDELKSSLGTYVGADGARRPVLLHCRADQDLDEHAVLRALNASFWERRSSTEAEAFDAEYGAVHPFCSADPRTGELVLQIFDPSVLLACEPPFTMMTNAGDLSWAVEFQAGPLVHALGAQARVLPITTRRSHAMGRQAPTIGILTGSSPAAGRQFWVRLSEVLGKRLGEDLFRGDVSYPPVLLRSPPTLALAGELGTRSDVVVPVLEREIIALCRDGADIVALPCPASQDIAPRLAELTQEHGSTFIEMADGLAGHLLGRGLTEVAFIGPPIVSEAGPWTTALARHKIRVEELPPAAACRVQQLVADVQMAGPSQDAQRKLAVILRQLVRARHVVLALPEMSLLLAGPRSLGRLDKFMIDSLDVYAEDVADAWFRRRAQAQV